MRSRFFPLKDQKATGNPVTTETEVRAEKPRKSFIVIIVDDAFFSQKTRSLYWFQNPNPLPRFGVIEQRAR